VLLRLVLLLWNWFLEVRHKTPVNYNRSAGQWAYKSQSKSRNEGMNDVWLSSKNQRDDNDLIKMKSTLSEWYLKWRNQQYRDSTQTQTEHKRSALLNQLVSLRNMTRRQRVPTIKAWIRHKVRGSKWRSALLNRLVSLQNTTRRHLVLEKLANCKDLRERWEVAQCWWYYATAGGCCTYAAWTQTASNVPLAVLPYSVFNVYEYLSWKIYCTWIRIHIS
jgi:hypothetical protein